MVAAHTPRTQGTTRGNRQSNFSVHSEAVRRHWGAGTDGMVLHFVHQTLVPLAPITAAIGLSE